MQIVISDHLPESGWDQLRTTEGVSLRGPFSTRGEVLAALADADALIVRSATRVDAELLDHGRRLRVVARAGARLDNIDLDEATRRGIMVINVPDANIFAVVEHAFGMLLALFRKIPEGRSSLQSGEWARHGLMGRQLYGRTIGIIGFGRLGREMAVRAQAFGMTVLVYDPYVDLSLARERGVQVIGFHELLARSDILVPMTAYTSQTHHLLDSAAFERIRSGAALVNVVHAGLVDEAALLQALNAGALCGAALDVFQEEPPGKGHPLVNHPLVLSVPHLNQNTVESQARTGRQVAADVVDALRGDDFRNVVNLPFNERATFSSVRPYIRLAEKLGKLQGQLADGWITRVEVELLGEKLQDLVRPIAAVLLSGMLLPVEGRSVNWVSAPFQAHRQGIRTSQAKNLVERGEYPNLLVCRIHWEGGKRTVAGTLFANGDARLVRYDDFDVDAEPEGFVLILENDDVPGIIGKVGVQLGEAGINIANWRYGRETPGGRAVSFINVDGQVPQPILDALARQAEIHQARLVRL